MRLFTMQQRHCLAGPCGGQLYYMRFHNGSVHVDKGVGVCSDMAAGWLHFCIWR